MNIKLTETDKTLANAIVNWWKENPNFNRQPLNHIKKQLKQIVNDSNLYISYETRKKNLVTIDRIYNMTQLSHWLSNMTMKADGLVLSY